MASRAKYQRELKERHKQEGRATINTALSLEATQALQDLEAATGWKKVQIVNTALTTLNNNRSLLKTPAQGGRDGAKEFSKLQRSLKAMEERLQALESARQVSASTKTHAARAADDGSWDRAALIETVLEVWSDTGSLSAERVAANLPPEKFGSMADADAMEGFLFENLEELTRLALERGIKTS